MSSWYNTEKWVNAHSPALQDLAKKVVNSYTFVDLETFKNKYYKLFEFITRDIIDFSKVILCGTGNTSEDEHESHKSSFWIKTILQEHFPTEFQQIRNSKDDSICVNKAINYAHAHTDSIYHLIFIDDALYSGKKIEKALKFMKGRFDGISIKYRVHICIPFISNSAWTRIMAIQGINYYIGDYECSPETSLQDISSQINSMVVMRSYFQCTLDWPIEEKTFFMRDSIEDVWVLFQHRIANVKKRSYHQGKMIDCIPTSFKDLHWVRICTYVEEGKQCIVPPYKPGYDIFKSNTKTIDDTNDLCSYLYMLDGASIDYVHDSTMTGMLVLREGKIALLFKDSLGVLKSVHLTINILRKPVQLNAIKNVATIMDMIAKYEWRLDQKHRIQEWYFGEDKDKLINVSIESQLLFHSMFHVMLLRNATIVINNVTYKCTGNIKLGINSILYMECEGSCYIPLTCKYLYHDIKIDENITIREILKYVVESGWCPHNAEVIHDLWMESRPPLNEFPQVESGSSSSSSSEEELVSDDETSSSSTSSDEVFGADLQTKDETKDTVTSITYPTPYNFEGGPQTIIPSE
jgi:hypothetical protein